MGINIETTLIIRGHEFKNRFIKGAMSEALSNDVGYVNQGIINLYQTWAEGGLGCAITGNVMIDKRAKNEPGVVVIENEYDLPMLKKWAQVGRNQKMLTIVQLSHPGRQCPRGLNEETVAPSAVPFSARMSKFFDTPRALRDSEINELIKRFVESARICEKAGFHGVQIHGAHGYLVSQFLSPLDNQRVDRWGGSIDNRMRFLLQIVKGIRNKTGQDFLLSVKLNSADFQKGGFSEDDSIAVIKALEIAGVDFIEISGGNYESPAMTGKFSKKVDSNKKQSTIIREAYFLDFAKKVREHTRIPLMVTGGFRTRKVMNDALDTNSCDFIGVARPLAIEPDFCNKLLNNKKLKYKVKAIKTGIKMVDSYSGVLEVIWYAAQFKRMAKNKKPNPKLSAKKVFVRYMLNNTIKKLKGKPIISRLRAK